VIFWSGFPSKIRERTAFIKEIRKGRHKRLQKAAN